MATQIKLFKLIDNELIQRAGISSDSPTFSYISGPESEENQIDFKEEMFQFAINEVESGWSPIEHNLKIGLKISIHDPSVLFSEAGVTDKANVLGVAVHFHSRSTGLQKTLHLGDIHDSAAPLDFSFLQDFGPGSLRGSIIFNFYIYLKHVNVERSFMANAVGTNLTDGYVTSFTVIADGHGSEFPIEEFEDPDEPLWRLQMNWTDIHEDFFDSTSVRLLLNRAHPVFDTLMKNERSRVNRQLFQEIMVNAMCLMVQKAKFINQENLEEMDESNNTGSIAQVLRYWIYKYNLDLTSVETIAYSFHRGASLNTGGDE